MMLPIAILAGGLATRLRPLTEKIPKSLIDVNGEPFIAHQLRLLRKNGIHQVVICAGYLGEMIQKFLGEGKQFDMDIHYSFDGDPLRGTAGAIKKALPLLGEQFFVIYGDSYLPCDFIKAQDIFQKSHKKALMSVFQNHGQWDKSNVEFANHKIVAYDKLSQTNRMKHIDYGLGLFKKEAFVDMPDEPYDLAALYQKLLKEKQLAAYETTQRFYEAGSLSGIEEFKDYLQQNPSC